MEVLGVPKKIQDGVGVYDFGELQESEEMPIGWWVELGVPISVANKIIRMNDGLRGEKKASFEKIAKYIEEVIEEAADKSEAVAVRGGT